MKRIIILIFIAVVFAGCNKQLNKMNEEKEFVELEKSSKKSKITETDCFLGFKFGWTEKQVHDFYSEQVKKGKFYIDDQDIYSYDFVIDESKYIKITFSPKYYEGKLYEMVYNEESNDGFFYSYLGVTMYNYFWKSEKGEAFKCLENEVENSYKCIKDNMVVTFTDKNIIYTNAPVADTVGLLNEKTKEVIKSELQRRANESEKEF